MKNPSVKSFSLGEKYNNKTKSENTMISRLR